MQASKSKRKGSARSGVRSKTNVPPSTPEGGASQDPASPDTASKRKGSTRSRVRQEEKNPPCTPEGGDTRAVVVAIADIERHPKQPRTVFDKRKLHRLAHSISDIGLLQRVGVRRSPEGARKPWQLAYGERRLRAAELAGWSEIPVEVLEVSDVGALRAMGEENLNRTDLNPMEKAQYLKTLSDPIKRGGAAMSDEAIAEFFGRSQSWVKNLKRLLELPTDWQVRVIAGEVRETQARALLAYKDQPNLLAAVAQDFDDYPEDYDTRERFERKVAFVAERFAAISETSQATEAPPDPGERHGSGRGKPAGAISRETKEPEKPAAQAPSESSNCDPFALLLRPYAEDPESLEAIRDLAGEMLAALGARERQASAA